MKKVSRKEFIVIARSGGAFILVVAIVILGVVVLRRRPAPQHISASPAAAPLARRAIDGVRVTPAPDIFPFGVMVENSVDAWPLSGISKANFVWEAPVEAGITRLLAIYADGANVPEIGPVRSARPYYVDWATEFHLLYAHVGGSPDALSLIPNRAVIDLNQFFNDASFWRSNKRPMPHNVYTSTTQLVDALAKTKSHVRKYDVWSYKDESPVSPPTASHVNVFFGNAMYNVIWNYDTTKNDYVRFHQGVPARDADGSDVHAKNVAIMETDISVLDAIGRRKVRTTGTGVAIIYRDGEKIIGTWKRTDLANRTRFFDATGSEISWNAGTTWIEVVPTGE